MKVVDVVYPYQKFKALCNLMQCQVYSNASPPPPTEIGKRKKVLVLWYEHEAGWQDKNGVKEDRFP